MEVKSTFELRRGAKAPDFELPDGTGKKTYELAELMDRKQALVVIFACNHCRYVKHVAAHLGEMAGEYGARGVQFVAVNSNDSEKFQEDSPDRMVGFAREHGWEFPYLYDETQDVARAYGAACTPDFFVFNANQELTYSGQFDGSRPGNSMPVTGSDLRSAIEATLRYGRVASGRIHPSTGCNIKWKEGRAPDYFTRLQSA
jgi:peroxiredoxin